MISRRLVVNGGIAAAIAAAGGLAVNRRAAARERAAEEAFPPLGEIIDVDGVPVHALVRGSGPDLVMLHGASGNLREFAFDLMDRFSDRYRVIAMDRPGLGYTGRTDPRYGSAFTSAAETPREQASLMMRAARQLGAERPIVLGHSFGGGVSLAWATYFGESVRGLVLLAPAAMEWEGGLGPLYVITSSAAGGATAVPLISALARDEQIESATRRIFAPDPVPDGYLDAIGGPLTLRRDSFRANARQVNGLKPYIVEMQALYPSLTLPIEWFHGTADTIVPADVHAKPFKALVPHTNLTLLDGVGHMPHHVVPDQIIAAVDRVAGGA